MERTELQHLVGGAIGHALAEARVRLDQHHRRRLARVLLRIAGRLALDAALPHGLFMALAFDALASEAQTSRPSRIQAAPACSENLN